MEIRCQFWLDLTMPHPSCGGLACGEVRPTTQQGLIRVASRHDMLVFELLLFQSFIPTRVACNLKTRCLVNKMRYK